MNKSEIGFSVKYSLNIDPYFITKKKKRNIVW